MHELVLKLFSFLKNLVKFFEIVIVFYAMLFVLYWAQNLIGTNWSWMKFSFGFFDSILYISKFILPQAISVVGTSFELKYLLAILLFVLIYYVNKQVYKFVLCLEDIYKSLRQNIKKFEENQFNKNLVKDQKNEQEKIKKFVIYVKTSVNNRRALGLKVDLDEQNKIMNKFLIEKTGVLPEVFEGGYLFKFNDFSLVDEKIEVFFKLLESSAPLDYLIIVQAYKEDFIKALDDLKRMILIDIKNKITMDSETSYRYSFNKNRKFETSKLGIYQKQEKTIEVLCFEKKYL